eukprot:tig00020828_g14372.t1
MKQAPAPCGKSCRGAVARRAAAPSCDPRRPCELCEPVVDGEASLSLDTRSSRTRSTNESLTRSTIASSPGSSCIQCGPRALDEDGSRSVAASAAGAVHVGPRLPIRIPLKAGVAPLALLRASLQRDRSRLRARPASTPSASPSSPPPPPPSAPPRRLRPPPEWRRRRYRAGGAAAERAERVVLRLPPGALACEAGATLPDIPVPGGARPSVAPAACDLTVRPVRAPLPPPLLLGPRAEAACRAPHALRVAAEGGRRGCSWDGRRAPKPRLELLDRFENPAPAPPAPPSASPALSPPRAAVPRTGGPGVPGGGGGGAGPADVRAERLRGEPPSVAPAAIHSTSPTVPRIPTLPSPLSRATRGGNRVGAAAPGSAAERRRREAAARYADQRLRAQPVHLPPPSGAAARLGQELAEKRKEAGEARR